MGLRGPRCRPIVGLRRRVKGVCLVLVDFKKETHQVYVHKSSRLGPNAFFWGRERMSSHQSLAGEKQPLLKLLGTGQLGSALSVQDLGFP